MTRLEAGKNMKLYIHPLAYKLELSTIFRWLRFFGLLLAAVLGYAALQATKHYSPLVSILVANAVIIGFASALIFLPEAITATFNGKKILASANANEAIFYLENKVCIDLRKALSVDFEVPGYFSNLNSPGGRSTLTINYGDYTERVPTKFQYRPLIKFVEETDRQLKLDRTFTGPTHL